MTVRRYVSPLRYPGGKAAMTSWLTDLFAQQVGDLPVEVWLEPFAGGAGAALTLLDRDAVGEAWLVDANSGIAAFWETVVADGPALADLVERTVPTLDLYDTSRALLEAPTATDRFRLGYAAFIVNRCSRSGIVAPTSGPMGGRTPAGDWSVGARFTAAALADRIRHVHSMRGRLRVHHDDGISFLEQLGDSGLSDEVVAFVDPPYIREGNRLYANGLDEAAHQRLADALNSTPARWVLTYDDEPVVADSLYPDRRVLGYDIRNTANRARVAREYAVFSDNLDVRGLGTPLNGLPATWVREHAVNGASSAHSGGMTTSPVAAGPRPCEGDCRTDADLTYGGDPFVVAYPDDACDVHGSPEAVEERLVLELQAARDFGGFAHLADLAERDLAAHRAKHHLGGQQ